MAPAGKSLSHLYSWLCHHTKLRCGFFKTLSWCGCVFPSIATVLENTDHCLRPNLYASFYWWKKRKTAPSMLYLMCTASSWWVWFCFLNQDSHLKHINGSKCIRFALEFSLMLVGKCWFYVLLGFLLFPQCISGCRAWSLQPMQLTGTVTCLLGRNRGKWSISLRPQLAGLWRGLGRRWGQQWLAALCRVVL